MLGRRYVHTAKYATAFKTSRLGATDLYWQYLATNLLKPLYPARTPWEIAPLMYGLIPVRPLI